jgi:hypothetical protein
MPRPDTLQLATFLSDIFDGMAGRIAARFPDRPELQPLLDAILADIAAAKAEADPSAIVRIALAEAGEALARGKSLVNHPPTELAG